MCVLNKIVILSLFCIVRDFIYESRLPSTALVFSYDFHAGAETMFSRHFNDPAADSYFTKRKWGEFFFFLAQLFLFVCVCEETAVICRVCQMSAGSCVFVNM